MPWATLLRQLGWRLRCNHYDVILQTMRKRTVTIRGVPEPVLRTIRSASKASRRSLNGELLVILERAAALPAGPGRGPGVRDRVAVPYGSDRPEPAERYRAEAVDRAALAAVCRRYHIRSLALFGSQARGAARPDSDVDVVVEFEPGMTPGLGIVQVAEALRPVLGGGRVDLVTRRGLPARLREGVLATAVPLYGG